MTNAPSTSNGNSNKAGQSNLKKYSWKEVEQHKNHDDIWIVVKGKVYDVTSWIPKHPGGVQMLLSKYVLYLRFPQYLLCSYIQDLSIVCCSFGRLVSSFWYLRLIINNCFCSLSVGSLYLLVEGVRPLQHSFLTILCMSRTNWNNIWSEKYLITTLGISKYHLHYHPFGLLLLLSLFFSSFCCWSFIYFISRWDRTDFYPVLKGYSKLTVITYQ